MFKRIYIEITNYCNLNCKFCKTIKNTSIMSFNDFKTIFDKVALYTKQIVLHVSGEPLMHNELDKIVKYIRSNNKEVMITTNGFLLNKYIDANKINISLHSAYNLDSDSLYKYLDNIYSFINMSHSINDKLVFNLRLWVDSFNNFEKIENYLSNAYNVVLDKTNKRLAKRVILCYDKEFTWPSLDNDFNSIYGSCHGGKTHLAILSDGRVSICCLDFCAVSNLGNVLTSSFSDIINSDKFREIITGFNNNNLVLDICRHCTYHSK